MVHPFGATEEQTFRIEIESCSPKITSSNVPLTDSEVPCIPSEVLQSVGKTRWLPTQKQQKSSSVMVSVLAEFEKRRSTDKARHRHPPPMNR